jgi:hypothetical protein
MTKKPPQWSEIIEQADQLHRDATRQRLKLAAVPRRLRPTIRWLLGRCAAIGGWVARAAREEAGRQ